MHTESRMRADNTVQVDVVQELRQINGKLDAIQNQMGLKAERHELESLRNTVEDVRRNGSGHAQDALRRLTENENRLGLLERDQASKGAVEDALRALASQQRSNRYFLIGLIANGFFSSLAILVSIVAIVVHFIK